MGVCNHCGNQVPDGQLTCPICGAYVGAGAQGNNQVPQQNMYNQQGMYNYNQAPQQNMYNQQGMYNYNQAPQQNMYNQQGMYNQEPQKMLGMKWYHFVIYFQLFAATLSGLYTGWQLMSGSIYGLNASQLEYVYSYFSGLKAVDTIIGICFMALGIFALITRFVLAGFKKAGPAMYIGMQVANLVVSIAYTVSVISIIGDIEGVNLTSIYSTIATSIVLLICNIVYFKKRKHLFDQ